MTSYTSDVVNGANHSPRLNGFIGQRWSPRGRLWLRGHILKSLPLASNPEVLDNCPVLGSRTALFFELFKFSSSPEKCFWWPYFWKIAWKKIFLNLFFFGERGKVFLKIFFFENTCAWILRPWPWPREGLSSVGLLLTLASSLVSLTPLLLLAGHGMEWNGNFDTEYGKCQIGMEWKIFYFFIFILFYFFQTQPSAGGLQRKTNWSSNVCCTQSH